VIATPHLGASTKEAQEGVAIEIAEAVVGALNGELSATAVNAPMVSPEVKNKYVTLFISISVLISLFSSLN
jgi:D-3-phosphoglycerate dehydrogenase